MIAISKKHFKITAYFLLCDMLLGILSPSFNSVYALTSGPSSPEFSSFEPVATTNLVDPVSGNFTYNLPVIQIPGPDGGGYAMSLSYHSGTSSEEESSWVGHGWTLNPGAINTSVRGLPDSYSNAPIDVYNKTRPSWTMTGLQKINVEAFSISKEDEGDDPPPPPSDTEGDSETGSVYNKPLFQLSFSKNIRFNNYQGISKTSSVGLSKGFGSLSMNRSETGVTYSATINPFALFRKGGTDTSREKLVAKEKKVKNQNPTDKDNTEQKEKEYKKVHWKFNGPGTGIKNYGSYFGIRTYTDVAQPVSLTKLKGINVNLSYGGQINPAFIPVSAETGYTGTFSLNHGIPYEVIGASGYMGSGGARTDYFTEKAQPFDKRDFFMGIPFSTPDNHSLSGEGLSGGFRAFANGPRSFYNTQDRNKIRTYGVGLEGMIGTNVGVGVNLSFGNTTTAMSNRSGYGPGATETKYRFYNDLGGKVDFANNNIANVSLTASPDFPGIKQVRNSIDDIDAFVKGGVDRDINLSSNIEELTDGGFDIRNESGIDYSYSEPILVRNSSNLSFGVNPNGQIEGNYLAYTPTFLSEDYNIDVCSQPSVTGEIRKVPYENTSLLRTITTPDYIDLGPEGPDDGDFGGWTSFEYHKKYGENSEENKWYRWRVPYTGLLYSKNSISDVKDDTGYVNTGEKEVAYLKKVETKTHVAYFVTNKSTASRFDVSGNGAKYLNGTGAARLDGLGAVLPNGSDPASNSSSVKGVDQLEYLEKIVLFSKARMDKPLQTTNFRYDYSLVQNLPNNLNGNYPNNKTSETSGKLTLQRVWSEFEGVVDARISSYRFGYSYTANHQIETSYSLAAQNPDYGPHLLDPWGNNQFDRAGNTNSATNRHLKLINWPYQGNIPESDFDPAAWQLKQIILPSGGEILVEYESKDYLYVQDRDVMAMVRLSNATNTYTDPTYTLDLSDIGGGSDDLCEKVQTYFLGENPDPDNLDAVGKRIYFKLLYALENNVPDIQNCQSEYITGYAKVRDISCSGDAISITLKGLTNPNKPNYVGSGLSDETQVDDNYRLTPRQACYDYYVTQRWGKYSAGCESGFEKQYEGAINGGLLSCGDIGDTKLKTAVKSLKYAQAGMEALGIANVDFPEKQNVCMRLNPSQSFLKIPMGKAKRGGGIRVKKLLMYDNGVGTGSAATYGQLYKYELEDGRSSGVATNEPQEMREENPLVEFMPKKDQTWINRLISGKDREQSEGPIGESLLPNASVSHSRVIVENIHTGKTGTGYTVHEFYTCKDYPFDKLYDYQVLDGDDRRFDFANSKPERGVDYSVLQDNMHNDRLRIPTPFFSYAFDKSWAAQGFRFIQNGMHGTPKSVRTYGGTYASGNTSYISSGQDFYYYEPGEKVRLFKTFDGKDGGTYEWDVPGKEMDVTKEGYEISNKDLDFQFEIDVSAGLTLPPPIFVTFSLVFAYNEQFLTKYATSKVIKYPVIQKKIVSYTDNIASTTENLAFDHATGRPVLTKTYDAYHDIALANSDQKHDGSIYNLNLPSHLIPSYSKMGQSSDTPSNTNQLLASSGQIVTYGSNANPIDEEGNWSVKKNRVISAGANTYNTIVGFSNQGVQDVYGNQGSSSVYRMQSSYAFKGEVKKSSDRLSNNGKIYEGGIMDAFETYDYNNNSQDEQWVKLNEVTKYSPNGSALEERDVLGVYSASKYGYNFTLPTMIAKNATYNEIYFEHFEDLGVGQNGIVENNAHSGIFSKQIASGERLIENVTAGELLTSTGAWLKFWTKSTEALINPSVVVNGNTYTPEFMAQTGEWSLYRVFIEPESFVLNQLVVPTLSFENEQVFIDDIKFNPKEAQTTCYVYDVKSLRLLTLFDDQHFGLYYQYNGEGQLVRKLIETEKGLKIITETQYNLPRENRNGL